MSGLGPLLPLPPALDQLLVIRRWPELTFARADEKSTALRTADAEKAGLCPRPKLRQRRTEHGIGVDWATERVRTDDCWQARAWQWVEAA
ncbi:hypothetical protein [Streptomyces goshikiensis]|uniref:hypothetical protein n=1 Tax=Streptomyces goshikiensis TaxID=1942 RepID=UPI00364B7C8B